MMGLPSTLPPGTVIGSSYIIGDLINRGGFGAVYRGTDTSEGNRPVAIKETYDVTPAARRQALMEASVLFTVRSKHLPEVYDALEANGRFYLVMQLIEGQDLLQLLRKRVPGSLVGEQEPHQLVEGPCEEQEILEWLLPVMDVLQELHSRNPPIMHRDIKPGNIILRPDRSAVLVDFGLTKLYDPKVSTQTLVKAVTEGFSPLEQYLGKTSPQSDIYSLAATIYLLLTNRRPPAAVNRGVNDTLIAPRLLNPSISPYIERALLKSLSVQADQRYQSMREFAAALRAPAFTAFADQTIAGPPVQSVNGQQNSTPIVLPAPPPPPRVYMPAPRPQPAAGYQSYAPPRVYPIPAPSAVPGYGMAPQQQVMMPLQALPSASGRGCLWGMLQGLLAGLLVAFTPQQSYFALAVVMGFLFFIIAGFATTRKGGSSFRGVWAGVWAGISSTVVFWLVYGIGYVILLTSRIQSLASSRGRLPSDAFQIAQSHIHTALPPPGSASTSTQQGLVNLAILVGVALFTAAIMGWFGGLFGRWWYNSVGRKGPRP